MRYLPIHVDMKDAKIAIVGGGSAAEAKLRTLIKTQANLVVIAPHISDEIQKWNEQGVLQWLNRSFVKSDIQNVTLLYAATEDDAQNAKIAELARAEGILVNACLLYTSPSPRDRTRSRMPSSA